MEYAERLQRSRTSGPSEDDTLLKHPNSSAKPVHQRLLVLQRAIGNQAVVQLLRHQSQASEAAGLKIGAVNHPLEYEANRVANQISEAPTHDVPISSAVEQVNRRQEPASESSTSQPVADRIARERGRGTPLEPGALIRMESYFGADLSDVRIHTGQEAESLNRQLGARAFTIGEDIFLEQSSSVDPRLLAHELTHVLQQRSLDSQTTHSDSPVIQRDANSNEFKRGYEDGLKGDDPNAGPLIDDALTDYNEGYAKGHYEFGHKTSTASTDPGKPKQPVDAEAARVAALEASYQSALTKGNWAAAAEFLNAFNADDILARLAVLSVSNLLSLEHGGWTNPRVGRKAQVVLIIHEVVSSIDPDAYGSPAVFPNNFGDKLGPVGGVVIGALGGLLALRMAAPLLLGYWRQIQITAGMAKIAAEADKEDAELAKQEVGTVIERLINTGGSQRVLVTYQSMTPALDRELYLTTQEGVQYAEAVSQGRNLYMIRIPERLFQILMDRQLIEVRQGSMGSQVGDDIRIAAGAMQFLSKHFQQIPLPK